MAPLRTILALSLAVCASAFAPAKHAVSQPSRYVPMPSVLSLIGRYIFLDMLVEWKHLQYEKMADYTLAIRNARIDCR
jgi:hypothetical protein